MERFSFAVFAEEYEQVVNETERFRGEIAREGRKGNSPAPSSRTRRATWSVFGRILRRRWRVSPLGPNVARAEVERCAEALEAFTQESYGHQRPAEGEEGL